MLNIAITTGEPAGIGPDITVAALLHLARQALPRYADVQWHVIGDAALLQARADAIGQGDFWRVASTALTVVERPLGAPVRAGVLDAANGRYVLDLLDAAIDGCQIGTEDGVRYDAMVTAPVQKSTINDAGVPFTGHTEYLAERSRTPRVVMMLAGPQPAHDNAMLRVALATTHLPLREVPDAITPAVLDETLDIVQRDLRIRFGLNAPRILVTGLNPHAGESGHLGREEIEVIEPAIARARARGIDARGPYPADTLFQPRLLADADCVLAMYHDQGLAPLKYGTFGHGVNITLGLPFVRTSVDHGTALDLAGTGRAEFGSMIEAIDTAIAMARHTARS
ncbi:4-hydroxythreonine-4-phosphate dehydrogenase [Ralstonia sp. GP73]|jgi:4-hydroxythreonine-4-phosphate dehydrogenase|uniref:4-hydroxythreonine-4-phosphate dehydrogenase n=1 Tax=Ralstonia thomasii TaxID=3058596 RepID=A0ABM9JAS6_9RALS|nr:MULTISPECIES: 4-hydroxythreonine-4-phosphate dehydrogenase PdxA [unclassified Ralstonia]MDH6641758.1 4-hydroxythreonine-4-phosphate dehydrogenase [Ralstonia sp. GP73]CAJ0712566.1 4-hydroxythreonine-4-phosphate dehydrogenase [Ralstonia sp. LMG 18095]CAJ0788203.1 4-hydroxythreonine-4-phosphate dehydrogenase [Ralstonia sp. LMG 18095]